MSFDRLTEGEEYYFKHSPLYHQLVMSFLEERGLPVRLASVEIDEVGNRGDVLSVWTRSKRVPTFGRRKKYKPLQYPIKAYA